MKLRITTILGCALLCAHSVFAGVGPSATYDPATGIMGIDTGADDIVAVFIGGNNVSVSGCSLCDGNNLPGADAVAMSSVWTVGFSAGSTQWIRTNPLQGLGFRGVMGEFFIDGTDTAQPWPMDLPPFLNFPEAGTGIANYGPGLTEADFPKIFSDGTGEADFNVTFATDDGRTFLANVNVVPEPATASLISLAGLALLGIRRRS